MTTILQLDDDDTLKKINIDELYEKKKMHDLRQISIFNKILNRIHKLLREEQKRMKISFGLLFPNIYSENPFMTKENVSVILFKNWKKTGFIFVICIQIHFLYLGKIGFQHMFVMK